MGQGFLSLLKKHKQLADDLLVSLCLGIIIGLVVALSAGLFFNAQAYLTSLWLSPAQPNHIGWQGLTFVGQLAGATLCAALLIFLLELYYPRKPFTPSDVILSVQFPGEVFHLPRALLSTLIALIAVSGGGSVGLYGPLVVFGAATAKALSATVRLQGSFTRLVIAAGTAAAISSAFATPLGGIVFAHEVILRHYRLKSFATVSLASVIAFDMGHFLNHDGLRFPVFLDVGLDLSTYTLLAFTGLLGGISAVIFMRLLEKGQKLARRLPAGAWHPWFVALCLIGAGAFVPQALGLGATTVEKALEGHLSLSSLIIILLIKMALTVVCLSGRFQGGVFSPALVMGALVGAGLMMAVGFQGAQTEGQDNLQIFVFAGMSAVIAPVIGGPLTTIIMVYEMTSSHTAAAAVAISVMLSSLVARGVYGSSFFAAQLAERGYDLSLGDEEKTLSLTSVRGLVSPCSPLLRATDSVEEARLILSNEGLSSAPVVDVNGRLLGMASLVALYGADKQSRLVDRIDKAKAIHGDLSQLDAIKYISSHGVNDVLVVDDEHKLLGQLYAGGLLSAYAEAHVKDNH